MQSAAIAIIPEQIGAEWSVDKTERTTLDCFQSPQAGDSKKWLDIASAIYDLDQKILALEIELGLAARTDAQDAMGRNKTKK